MVNPKGLKDEVNVFIPYDQKCGLCGTVFHVAEVWKESRYCELCRDRINSLSLPMQGILSDLLSRIEKLEAKKP